MNFKNKKWWIAFIFILTFGLFFRTFNFEKSFSFAHDQDLYSWIAKDIVINQHQRLVGQVTSVDGVFIGSFYYYLMAAFYRIFNMDPLSAIIPLTLIGLFNIATFGQFLRKHYSNKTSIIGMIIWATTFGLAYYERWSVPTQTTLTWSLWFLWVIFELYKGNLKYLPIYGLLVGFTWQLHIALLPILPIPILAYFVGNNKLSKLLEKKNLRYSVLGILILGLTISPFLLFEIKHNFSQIKSMAAGINLDWGGPTGIQKLEKVLNSSGREFQQRVVWGWDRMNPLIMWLVLGLFWLINIFKKNISGRISGMLLLWIFMICWSQFVSKRVVSEYYFSNLAPIYILILTLLISNINKKVASGAMLGLIAINCYWLVTRLDIDTSYYYKKETVEYISREVKKYNYPCIAINYIADQGVGVGFRYLLWKEGIDLIKPNEKVPVYNIVIPWQISGDENNAKYGRFGVIVPKKIFQVDSSVCQEQLYKLDPLLGYTE